MERSDAAFNQRKSQTVRYISPEEKERLENDKPISEFKREKLEKDALKNWDLFYKRNGTRFFKDRHWTCREFKELTEDYVSKNNDDGSKLMLLEIGSGVGNAVFPLLEENSNLFVYACDFSPRAIQHLKDNPSYNEACCHAFQCDVVSDDLAINVIPNSVDIVTLIFVFSAILPSKMQMALQNISKTLKPGGVILFRDYGLYDHAMLRFSRGHKIEENLYVRQDGTRSYFFSIEFTSKLFTEAGFEVVENDYIQRATINKKESIDVPRIFVQGKYRKKNEPKDDGI